MLNFVLADEVPFYAAADERIVDLQREGLKVLKALCIFVWDVLCFISWIQDILSIWTSASRSVYGNFNLFMACCCCWSSSSTTFPPSKFCLYHFIILEKKSGCLVEMWLLRASKKLIFTLTSPELPSVAPNWSYFMVILSIVASDYYYLW